MKRIEVFQWKVGQADGRSAVTHMTWEDGRAMDAEFIPGTAAYVDVPESNDEIIESWLTGKPYRLVAASQELKKAA